MRVPDVIVVDDFLADPDAVRRHALQQPFVKMHSAGLRTQGPRRCTWRRTSRSSSGCSGGR